MGGFAMDPEREETRSEESEVEEVALPEIEAEAETEVVDPAEADRFAQAAQAMAKALTAPAASSAPLSTLARALGNRAKIEVDDVQASLAGYRSQDKMLEAVGRGVPCVDVEGDDPLPLWLLDPSGSAESLFLALDSPATFIGETSEAIREHTRANAKDFLRRRLASFLSFRLLARSRAGAPPTAGVDPDPGRSPSTNFRVETPGRVGWRVHYSPAYFLDPYHQFGSNLSTPVDGFLRPGRYVFGAKPVDGQLRWDSSAMYDVPGGTSVAQLHLP
jgi:hypothetical protein